MESGSRSGQGECLKVFILHLFPLSEVPGSIYKAGAGSAGAYKPPGSAGGAYQPPGGGLFKK